MFITLTRWSMERMPLTRALGALALVLALLALPSVASAQTGPNAVDFWQDAATPEPNVHYEHPNTAGFTAAGEPHYAGNGSCRAGDGSGTATVSMEDTFWHKVVGTGGPITLTTVRSNFNTVVAVYQANQMPSAPANALFCNDDNRGDDVELSVPLSSRSHVLHAVGRLCGLHRRILWPHGVRDPHERHACIRSTGDQPHEVERERDDGRAERDPGVRDQRAVRPDRMVPLRGSRRRTRDFRHVRLRPGDSPLPR